MFELVLRAFFVTPLSSESAFGGWPGVVFTSYASVAPALRVGVAAFVIWDTLAGVR